MDASNATSASDTAVPSAAEQVIWSGTPSQIVNLKAYLIGLAILGVCFAAWAAAVAFEMVVGQLQLLFLVPIAIVLLWLAYRWIRVSTTRYELTTQRLRLREGILAKTTDELELYRVRDWTLHEPLLFRILKLGTLTLITTDQTTPQITLPALPDAHQVREQLRQNVEIMRTKKKVREIDFE